MDVEGLPTGRAVGWAVLGWPVRMRAVRLLADAEGLDGFAAGAAVAAALGSDRSPWAGPVDAAVRQAVHDVLAEACEPLVVAMRTAAAAGSAFFRVLASIGPLVVADDVEGCRCLCATHHEQGTGLCLGLDAPELMPFTFPGPPRTTARRTVRMCGPCAVAQETRFRQHPVPVS